MVVGAPRTLPQAPSSRYFPSAVPLAVPLAAGQVTPVEDLLLHDADPECMSLMNWLSASLPAFTSQSWLIVWVAPPGVKYRKFGRGRITLNARSFRLFLKSGNGWK